jgi:hypothetical protein
LIRGKASVAFSAVHQKQIFGGYNLDLEMLRKKARGESKMKKMKHSIYPVDVLEKLNLAQRIIANDHPLQSSPL